METKTGTQKRIWIVTAILAAVVIAAVVAGVAYSRSDAVRFRRQIDLGNKYLEELNYEQAIAEFTRALEIMPDDESALSALASAYIGWGSSLLESQDYEKAVDILEEGYNKLPENADIRESLVQTYLQYAEALLEKGDEEKAISVLTNGFSLLSDERLKKKLDEIQRSKEKTAPDVEEEPVEEDGISKEQSQRVYDELSSMRDYDVLGKRLCDWDYESMVAYVRDNAVESNLTGVGNPDREEWILENGISGEIMKTGDLVTVWDGNNNCYYQFQRDGWELGSIVCYEANEKFPVVHMNLDEFFGQFGLTLEELCQNGTDQGGTIYYYYHIDERKMWFISESTEYPGYYVVGAEDTKEKYGNIQFTVRENEIQTIMMQTF